MTSTAPTDESRSTASNETETTQGFVKVLSGVDNVVPLAKGSMGEQQASALGFGSKLVSKWFIHECSHCPARWSEFDNVDDETADLRTRTSQVPIIHRYEYSNKHWITKSVTVQDPSMREVLRVILHKYQDLDLELIDWTFEPPFMPLVHRWEKLKTHYTALEQGPIKNAASALLAFLTPIVSPSVLSLDATHRTGKVSFANVWQIFPPRTIVKTKFFGVDTLCRVVRYKFKPEDRCNPDGWVIDMEYVDWNGETAGWTTTKLTIWDYEGLKKVAGLPVFPIEFSPDAAKFKEQMMARGERWAGLRGYKYCLAQGTKVLLETEEPEQRPVSGKVCVDAYAYYRVCNIVKPILRPLAAHKAEESEEDDDDDSNDVLDSDGYNSNFKVAQVEAPSQAKGPMDRAEELAPLTDDELLMTCPWMKGFDFKSKSFCELKVADLEDMKWNDEAFEKLVLPGGEKELAWTFVENKSQCENDFDDFVADKGRGLIILMFGPPGVGKTFTAEAVAERSRVPLYSMSAGDLGTQVSLVEKALERALDLCRMWNAMLLLDEADVFLGERTSESLARNELVSIFLTKLEYYQGIIFLTTNRISSIDHAFQSRVDLFLPYRDLEPAARRQVWDNFIDRAGRHRFQLTPDAMDKLSELKLNGREIKNLIKSAQLLSLKGDGKVPVERLLLLADKRVQALKELDSGSGH
jgi:hypothetical protein